MPPTKVIQLGDFCRMLHIADREVRYVLERGLVPPGAAQSPATGNPRQFGPAQAFWLALVVKLRQGGLNTSLAATTANIVSLTLKGVTHHLNWDWRFWPDRGQFDTDHQYFLEVADRRYWRVLTDACPSEQGLHALPWFSLDKKGRMRNVQHVSGALRPIVVLRIDLTEISRILGGSTWTEST